MNSKIVIYFTLYNTSHSWVLSRAKRAQRSIMGSKIWLATHSRRSIHMNSLCFWSKLVSKKVVSRYIRPLSWQMSLSLAESDFNKGIYNVYLTVYIGHPGYGQLTAVKIGYLLISATWPYRGLRYTFSLWWHVFLKFFADQTFDFNW